MTYEEAKTNITAYVYMECENMPKQVIESLDIARQSINKQIPIKPLNETGYYRDNKCPSCFKPIKSGKGSSSHYRNNWCNNCGQAIDWSEV